MFQRYLDLPTLLERKSLFLFGSRQTGKTTLVKNALPDARFVNLLEADTFRELATRPETLRKSLTAKDRVVVIDEIQRSPNLLNEVQVMIDSNPKLRFVLTGSSARSLRKGGVNLLGGRAQTSILHPLISPELSYSNFERRFESGSLPRVILSPEPFSELNDYLGTYLQEEIRAESLVRSVETFSRFLEVAALSNGKLINFEKIGSDAGVPARTVREHFTILEDTLIGRLLPPFRRTLKRKGIATSKFYFFDIGVAHALMRRFTVRPGNPEFGNAFEHLIHHELAAYRDYSRTADELTFWRTHSGFEIDFLLGDTLAVEAKATSRVNEQELKSMRVFAEEFPKTRRIVVCLESKAWTTDDGIVILPLEQFCRELWSGKLAGGNRQK